MLTSEIIQLALSSRTLQYSQGTGDSTEESVNDLKKNMKQLTIDLRRAKVGNQSVREEVEIDKCDNVGTWRRKRPDLTGDMVQKWKTKI